MLARILALYTSLIMIAHAKDNTGAYETNPMNPASARQCGITMRIPALRNVADQALDFGCTGAYKADGGAVLSMDFQYDISQHYEGNQHISFTIENVGIDEKISSGKGSIFRNTPDITMPILSAGAAYANSNCGPSTMTSIKRIQGVNWHGWIAERSFGKNRPDCKLDKEYTSRYRCIQVMFGNDTMTAQLWGVCLLRKKYMNVENGFSYDLFMDMLLSARFVNE